MNAEDDKKDPYEYGVAHGWRAAMEDLFGQDTPDNLESLRGDLADLLWWLRGRESADASPNFNTSALERIMRGMLKRADVLRAQK